MTSTATYARFNTSNADNRFVAYDLLTTGLTEDAVALAAANGCDSLMAFGTEAERDAFIALFPKMVGVKQHTFYRADGVFPAAMFRVSTVSTGVTGALNETGAKRLARYTAILATVFPAR